MEIIKDREVIQDDWIHLMDDALPDRGPITVSLTRWNAEKKDLMLRDGGLGIRIDPGDSLETLVADLANFQLVAIEFPIFTDGRGFSTARLLRDSYGFRGEVRAKGDFLPDQVSFLARVGFDAFEFNDPANIEVALKAFDDFTVTYQSCSDVTEPPYQPLTKKSRV